MAASFAGNAEMAKVLLEHGAKVNTQDIDGRSALHFAAEHTNAVDVIPALIRAGADVNLKLDPTAKHLSGATPLIVAAAMGNAQAVKLLLNAGADENVLTWDRMTALDVARHPPILPRPGHAEVIKLLENTSHEEVRPKQE
jgi:ankyrin repeat protein